VSDGAAELVLVSGYSGIGKSVLVHEIHKEIVGAHGYFASGKFDQLNRSVPYASIAEAFKELVHQILTEREASLSLWRARILAAVGANGKVLCELIPDLPLLLGPQPDVPELSAAASQSRFALVFQALVRVLATAEHPLVVFLDDLQWADLASLSLLKLLVTAPESGSLLVIGAYRSNEVDPGHPLLKVLSEIEEAARCTAIELRPLGRADVGQFVADALGASRDEVEPLARVVFEKTEGNPFFFIQFLTALEKDGLLVFDAAAAAFRWDVKLIRARMATDNVIDFMAARIRKLDPRTARVLRLAACIGHRFELRALSTIREAPPVEAAADLWEALKEGIVVPLGSGYRVFYGAAGEAVQKLDASYRFLHDRVQQAAYSLIDEEEKAAVHLRIGRLLLAVGPGGGDGAARDDLFEIVAHMNRGAALIADPGERRRLARLNLDAGRRARAAAAYAEAAGLFAVGMSVLDARSWDDAYDLSFALHLERAECEAMGGAIEEAESLHRTLLERAVTDLDRTRAYDLCVVLCAAQGRSADAVEVGLKALRALGFEVFDTEEQWKAAFDAELDEVTRRLAGRSIEELADAPAMTDPLQRAVLRLFTDLTGPAFGLRPRLSEWIIIKPVNLCLEHGNASESASIYALHGAHLANLFGRHAEGYAFARLGLALHEKLGGREGAGMLHYFVGNASHNAVHWRKTLEYFERAYVAGLESGDLVAVSFSSSHKILGRLALGDPLHAVRDEAERLIALTERTRVASSRAILTASRQMIDNLLGCTRDRGTLSCPHFDEAEFEAWMEAKGFKLPVSWYCTAKGELAFLYEDYEGAVAMLARAKALGSINFTTEIVYYASLAILAFGETAPGSERERLAPLLATCMGELAVAARGCAENYLHKSLLVQAEVARTSHDHERAAGLYDEAIEAAQQHGWLRDVALGSELCAKFYLRRGRTKIARGYMADAVHAYAQWGAVAKVQQLTERYPELVPAGGTQAPAHAARPAPGGKAALDQLDMAAFVRVLQTLASELVLDNVLDRLMRVVLQSAGAQRCFLLLEREGELVIEAAAATDPDRVSVGLSTPLDDGAELAVTLVRYVDRLKEPLVLSDAASESRFAADPYIASRRPRSIACLAMMSQGRSNGVLYLENNATGGAFSRERVELLGLLLSQAAISVENARLYARVEAVKSELQRSTEVIERSNEELRGANARLSIELAERQRSEELRYVLQEEILRVQADKLVELSTPIIPIAQGVLVMPLIGAMDADRAQQVLEVALSGVHARRARVVIFDITGVKGVDAQVASTLFRTADALRLLGTEAVITGVNPEVARTLVALGVGFGSAVTQGDLESGIVHALGRVGVRWVGAPRGGAQAARRRHG
jgi:predicted ATPase/GAF domain-containing protein